MSSLPCNPGAGELYKTLKFRWDRLLSNLPLFPRIDNFDACWRKIIHISSNYRHPVNQCRSRDERVAIRPWGGNVKSGATLCNRSIDRQNTITECWKYLGIDPGAKHRALSRVAALHQKRPFFKFQNGNNR